MTPSTPPPRRCLPGATCEERLADSGPLTSTRGSSRNYDGDMKLGPGQGTVTIRTGVAGSAARMGHRLVIAVTDWRADIEMDGDIPTAVTFTAELDSLSVQSGKGGVTPLTVVDKQVIKRNAAKVLESSEFPQVEFRSESLLVTEGTVDVAGTLTIHGVSEPLDTTLTLRDGRVTGSIPITQSDFGIHPYSAMLGQLKVNDEVMVELDIAVV